MSVWLNAAIIYKYPLLYFLVNFTFFYLCVLCFIINLSFDDMLVFMLYAGSTITLSDMEIKHRQYLAEYESKNFCAV